MSIVSNNDTIDIGLKYIRLSGRTAEAVLGNNVNIVRQWFHQTFVAKNAPVPAPEIALFYASSFCLNFHISDVTEIFRDRLLDAGIEAA